jgi:hypothetical protein
MKDLSMGSTIGLIFKLLAFDKLLAYPQLTLGVPPLENCWTRRYVCVFFCWSFNRSVVSLSICMSLSKVLSICVPASLFDCLNNFFLYNIIYFYFSQYYKLMTSLLSLLSEIGEMRASKKCHPGLGCRIEPRSSCTRALCPTYAPLHIHNNFFFFFFNILF